MRKPFPKKKTRKILLSAVLCLIIYGILLPFPWEKRQLEKCVVLLECQHCYQLTAPGCETLYFSSFKEDGSLAGLSCHLPQARQTVYGTAFWYGSVPLLHLCRGTLLTSSRLARPDTLPAFSHDKLTRLLKAQDSIHTLRLQNIQKEEKILAYYMATHNVVDEGYNQMGQYQKDYQQMRTEEERIHSILNAILLSGKGEISLSTVYIAHSHTPSSAPATDTCLFLSSDNQVARLQTLSRTMPSGSRSIGASLLKTTLLASRHSQREATLTAYHYGYIDKTGISQMKPSSIEGRIWKDDKPFSTSIPLLKGAEGSPLTDYNGSLIGIVCQNHIIPF